MIGGGSDPNLYFDPGFTYEKPWDALGMYDRKRRLASFAGPYRAYVESNGATGSASHMLVEYALNSAVGNISWLPAGNCDMDSKVRGWRLSQIDSSFPLLCEARTIQTVDTISISSHEGRGFNVCFGDGSVQFYMAGDIIRAGIRNNIISTYSAYWASYSAMPIDPAQDPDYALGATSLVLKTVAGSMDRYASDMKTFRAMRKRR